VCACGGAAATRAGARRPRRAGSRGIYSTRTHAGSEVVRKVGDVHTRRQTHVLAVRTSFTEG
jgi:hypothetical protein